MNESFDSLFLLYQKGSLDFETLCETMGLDFEQINSRLGVSMRKDALQLIAKERLRQLEQWSPEHDRHHDDGELAVRAAELAVFGTGATVSCQNPDGWGLVEKHRDDRLRQLVIAAALIAAEIDRISQE